MKINVKAIAVVMGMSLSLFVLSAAMSAAAEAEEQQDIVFTSDFEDGDYKLWSPFGGNGSVKIDDTAAHDSKNSLKISGRTQTYNGPSIIADSMFIPGETYNFSSWVYHNTDDTKIISWTIRYIDSLGVTSYESIDSKETESGVWTELSGTLDIPEDIISVLVYYECSNATSEFNVDDVVITGKTPETQDNVDKKDGYVYYSDFEKNAGAWYSRGDEHIVYTDEYSHTGSFSLYCTERSKTWNGPCVNINDKVEREKKYYYSAYVMYNGDEYESKHVFRIELQYSLNGEARYELIADKEISKNEWSRISGAYTLPEGAETIGFYVQTANVEEGETPDNDDLMSFYIDTVSIADSAEVYKDYAMYTAIAAVAAALILVIAVIFIRKAIKTNKTLNLASIDAMTKAFNRNAYEKAISELNDDPEKIKSLYFAMCDINFMKYINDTMGHKKGDEAITRCGELLLDISSKYDGKVYRTGGDEFVCVIGKPFEDEVRNAIKKESAQDKGYPFEVAVGFARYDEELDGDTPNAKTIISRCDKAMYEDKSRIKSQNQKYSR